MFWDLNERFGKGWRFVFDRKKKKKWTKREEKKGKKSILLKWSRNTFKISDCSFNVHDVQNLFIGLRDS